MTIVGVDPGTKMPAYCIMSEGGEIKRYGKFTLEPLERWQEIFREADIVAVEGQFLGINVHTAIKLSFSAGMLAGAARLAGAVVEVVPPRVWQARMLRCHKNTRRKVLKALSREIASAVAGKKIADGDIADAVLICEYVRQKNLNRG
jgi:Holliday junction resolvasome RuvABC endonuclease subunit